ncbi:MAG: hypothetical protein MGF17_03365 [Trichodesmium sp. MAG_R04]|nr:hypothetical protein [Trichodesmium sp. MAG_R04]
MLKFSQRLLLTSYLPIVLYFDCYTMICMRMQGENLFVPDFLELHRMQNQITAVFLWVDYDRGYLTLPTFRTS